MKILRIIYLNSAFILTNGIRKVRKEVDIFNKKEFLILVSSSQTVLQNTDSSTSIVFFQPAVYPGVTEFTPICIILYNYSIACQLSNSQFFKVFYPTMCCKNFNEIIKFEKGKYVLNFSKIPTYLT